jgi:3-oxo-5alpha-steroid 4-dehydrogenase
VLVDRQWHRICNERLYGAQVTDIMIKRHRSEGVLIIDHDLWKRTFRMLGPSRVTWFQFCLAFPSLFLNRRAKSLQALAERLGIPPDKLLATIHEYNRVAREHGEDPMGKLGKLLKPIEAPPFYAIDSSINGAWFGCPSITMGGLVVDETSGQVKREDGSLIPGLYAAGRTAVGLPTESYVSGLSLADCVFSGRRAGQHAARAA